MEQYFAAFGLLIGISLLSAYSAKDNSFSLDIFLVSFSIIIGILVWIPLIPTVSIIISIFIIIALLIRGRNGSENVE